jgi:hypothetical protein
VMRLGNDSIGRQVQHTTKSVMESCEESLPTRPFCDVLVVHLILKRELFTFQGIGKNTTMREPDDKQDHLNSQTAERVTNMEPLSRKSRRWVRKEHDDSTASLDDYDYSYNVVYDYFHLPQLAADYVLVLLKWIYRCIVTIVQLVNAAAHTRK